MNFRIGDLSEIEKAFGCDVLLDQNVSRIIFKKEDLEKRINSSDYELLKILLATAYERSKANQKVDLINRVKNIIINNLNPTFPSIDIVAGQLNKSTRSLQRELSQLNTSFNSILIEVKKELSINYLKNNDLCISDISFLLDFSEPSSFNRSFKNWFGVSPGRYRKEGI